MTNKDIMTMLVAQNTFLMAIIRSLTGMPIDELDKMYKTVVKEAEKDVNKAFEEAMKGAKQNGEED